MAILLAFTNAEANAFIDNAHTIACGLFAGWLLYQWTAK
jgi:hypothetical protein